MGITGIWQWVIILAVVLILFARPGKISGIMGDFGKGLSKFKKGMKDENAADADVEVEDVEGFCDLEKDLLLDVAGGGATGANKFSSH